MKPTHNFVFYSTFHYIFVQRSNIHVAPYMSKMLDDCDVDRNLIITAIHRTKTCK